MNETELPDDLRAALENMGVSEAFHALPPSHRKEHLRAVAEARRPETRKRRIEWMIEKLKAP